jgi:chorismate mutase
MTISPDSVVVGSLAQSTDTQQLVTLRSQLDEINLQLLAMLEARGRIAREVIVIKQRIGRPVHDPGREGEMMQTLLSQSAKVFPRAALEQIFAAIFAASRSTVAVRPMAESRSAGARRTDP